MLKKKHGKCIDSKLISIEITEKIKAKWLKNKEYKNTIRFNYREWMKLIRFNYTIMKISKILQEYRIIWIMITYTNIKIYIVECMHLSFYYSKIQYQKQIHNI